jgi:hypothetical protein
MSMFSGDAMADEFVRGFSTQIANNNMRATGNYDDAYKSAVHAAAENGIFTPPEPVTVTAVDLVKLRRLYVAYDQEMQLLETVFKPFDYTSALTTHKYSKPAPSNAPPPPPPTPSDPVGFDEGNGFYSVVPGDTFPIGHVVNNSRGVFVKVGGMTPFGPSVGYRAAALLPAQQ